MKHHKLATRRKFRLFALAEMWFFILRYAFARETMWRMRPVIDSDRDFSSDEVSYVARCRFTTTKWFGRWSDMPKADVSGVLM